MTAVSTLVGKSQVNNHIHIPGSVSVLVGDVLDQSSEKFRVQLRQNPNGLCKISTCREGLKLLLGIF